MRFQFKHQKFQADAAKAVVDVFAGQPCLLPGQECGDRQTRLMEGAARVSWYNEPIVSALSDGVILEQLRKVQRANKIKPSEKLEGHYNLTVEMETGVGKTYTYIKTIYELNRRYGWSKFIVVVPNIAIREGVYKSFQMTQEHFAGEYGKKIWFFIYNSAKLGDVDKFASDSALSVMIINSQSFNARGKDARRITMKLDEFRSRRPIDMIARTNPILIVDEPQSVEGKQTKERMKEFHPLLTLRYSATHKADSLYNMVYRLDAMEAYNKRLVKKIEVKGISESGCGAEDGFVYLEGVNISEGNPTASMQFDCKGTQGIRKKTAVFREGGDLYERSGRLDEYKTGFVVKRIDGRDNSVEFLNGIRLYAGELTGKVSEDQLRRIQIRETILSHIERERQLFYRGIKVLSLFFVDEVAKYKRYDEDGHPYNGIYADMFEEEYADVVRSLTEKDDGDEYLAYLNEISPKETHAGYFSIDKKGKMTNSRLSDKSAGTSDDIDAYDLIMKNKELLLDRDPHRSPVRFLFSHSALREGWDNPNVFQICTLKQSDSKIRKRQEVGRGLRLSVDQDGERMDVNALGGDVHTVNILTVIASESYETFAQGLQTELADAVVDRHKAVDEELFVGKVIADRDGNEQVIDRALAKAIIFDLVVNRYIDKQGALTDRYYQDRENGMVQVAEEAADSAGAVLAILDSVYDRRAGLPENARDKNVQPQVDREKLDTPEFMRLWEGLRQRSAYEVDFDAEDLVRQGIERLDRDLHVSRVRFQVETGGMQDIASRQALLEGTSFQKLHSASYEMGRGNEGGVKYDLLGKLTEETGLTRETVARLLAGVKRETFLQFQRNPEEFILRTAKLINEVKAAAIVRHIHYYGLEEYFPLEVLTWRKEKGTLGKNAMPAAKHLYDYVLYDSEREREFAAELEASDHVLVYCKLPKSFYITTPVGRYTPDWAIVFRDGEGKASYFVVETKGTNSAMGRREIENAKIHCARVHFEAVGKGRVTYLVADSFQTFLERALG